MSKLTKTLESEILRNPKDVSMTFDPSLLDQDLIDQLSIHLSIKSVKKLIKLSFLIASAQKMNTQESIIDQMNYKSAKQLIEAISQKPKTNTEKMQRVNIPRWMVLIIGSEVYSINGKSSVAVEDAINYAFRLCLDFLDRKF
jgi:hypothetical protein